MSVNRWMDKKDMVCIYNGILKESEVVQSCPTLFDRMYCKAIRLLSLWNFPGKSTGVGCHFSAIKNNAATATAAAKSLQSCPTLCDPIDGSPPGSPVPGILQARTLESVTISFSNAWKWKVKVKSLSGARLLATHGLQPTRLLRPWEFPGKSTGVGCHCLLWRSLLKFK